MVTDSLLSKLIPLAIGGFLYHLSLIKRILNEKGYKVNGERISRLMNVCYGYPDHISPEKIDFSQSWAPFISLSLF
jgi:hypothetical protein